MDTAAQAKSNISPSMPAVEDSTEIPAVSAPSSSSGSASNCYSVGAPSGSGDIKQAGVAQAIVCSKLSFNGRKDRAKKLGAALDAASGDGSVEEKADAVLQSLREDERGAFLDAFKRLAAPKQEVERALLQEVLANPEQTGRSALARAAESAGAGRRSLHHAGAGLRISGKFWRRAVLHPQRVQKQQGGRPMVVNNPVLRPLVKEFLVKHSKETSRFCRTKAVHRKAARAHMVIRAQGGRAWGRGVYPTGPGQIRQPRPAG